MKSKGWRQGIDRKEGIERYRFWSAVTSTIGCCFAMLLFQFKFGNSLIVLLKFGNMFPEVTTWVLKLLCMDFMQRNLSDQEVCLHSL
jgi:hypothetical protein